MKEYNTTTLHFHLKKLFIPDSESGASSEMGPLKRRFELLLSFSRRSASLPASI